MSLLIRIKGDSLWNHTCFQGLDPIAFATELFFITFREVCQRGKNTTVVDKPSESLIQAQGKNDIGVPSCEKP